MFFISLLYSFLTVQRFDVIKLSFTVFQQFRDLMLTLFYSFSTVQRFDVNVVAEKDRVEKRIFFKNAPQPDMVSYTQELRYQELEGCEKMVIYLAVSIHRYRNLRTIGRYFFLKSLASF